MVGLTSGDTNCVGVTGVHGFYIIYDLRSGISESTLRMNLLGFAKLSVD